MSRFDYEVARRIVAADPEPSFAGLIMAAARKADTDNLDRLSAMWPETVDELRQRYDAPGGLLPDEVEDRAEGAQK